MFLSKDGTVKIGDLGVSKVNHGSLMFTQTGTPYYTCPEIWQDKPYDYKSDIWSFGVIVYQLCKLTPPFDAKDMAGLAKAITKGVYTKIPAVYSADLSQVIKYCLQVTPYKRTSSAALWEKTEIKSKLEEFDCQDSDAFRKKLLQTIKISNRISDIDRKLPSSKYDIPENPDEESKVPVKSRRQQRIYSARPNNKKLSDKKSTSSSKKSIGRGKAKRAPLPGQFKPKSNISSKLSPNRGIKNPVAPMSAGGKRKYIGARASPSPNRYVSPRMMQNKPAGMPSQAKRFF